MYDSNYLARYPVSQGEVKHLTTENVVKKGALTTKITITTLTTRQGWHYFRFEDIGNQNRLLQLYEFGAHPVELYENNGNPKLLPLENVWLRRVKFGARRDAFGVLHLFAWSASGQDQFVVILCEEEKEGCPGFEASLEATSLPNMVDPLQFVSHDLEASDHEKYNSSSTRTVSICELVFLLVFCALPKLMNHLIKY